MKESGCNANTKTVSTPREKLKDKLVLDGRRSPILKGDEATRYRPACMRLSYLAKDGLDLGETAKRLAQRMSEPREFDFFPLKRAARYLVGKPKAALEESSILKKEDATRNRSAFLHETVAFRPSQITLCGNNTTFGPEDE